MFRFANEQSSDHSEILSNMYHSSNKTHPRLADFVPAAVVFCFFHTPELIIRVILCSLGATHDTYVFMALAFLLTGGYHGTHADLEPPTMQPCAYLALDAACFRQGETETAAPPAAPPPPDQGMNMGHPQAVKYVQPWRALCCIILYLLRCIISWCP